MKISPPMVKKSPKEIKNKKLRRIKKWKNFSANSVNTEKKNK